jgi:hypothetical protein
MLKSPIIFLIFIFLFSCTSHDEKKSKYNAGKDTLNKNSLAKAHTKLLSDTAYYKFKGDSVIIPSFEVEVSLSSKAKQKLQKDKETIIVIAYFSGQPKDTTSEEYLRSGEMDITTSRIELSDSTVAKFEGVKFSKSLYDSLADKDIQLLINVVSGRKSTNDNLLNCDILEDKMSKIKGKRFTIKGKLIYGDD